MPDTPKTTIQEFESGSDSSYDTYQSYNNTNIEWLGKIPDHWTLAIVDQIARLKSGFSFDSDHFNKDSGFPLIRIRNIKGESINLYYDGEVTPEMRQVIVENGDLIVGMDGDFRVFWWDDENALLNQRMTRITSDDYYSRRYLYYLLPIALGYIQEITPSTTVKHLSTNEIRKLKIPKIPEEELESIVNFLDEETKKIDHLIREKSKLIDLIQEKRIAIISDAVTQGLDSDVETKHSGVPGLGEVPEDWDVVPLKHSSRNITVGIVQKPTQYYVDEGVPALRAVNVESNEIVKDDLVHISEECNEELGGSRLRAGDLISVRRGDPGTTAVVPEELDGANCISMVIIRKPDEYIPEFLCHLMNSEVSRSQVEAGTTGATMEHFNAGDVQELSFPKPDIEEQREILDWLSPRIREIDELREKINEGIELLKKYRTALITEAVTGQIDVRGEV